MSRYPTAPNPPPSDRGNLVSMYLTRSVIQATPNSLDAEQFVSPAISFSLGIANFESTGNSLRRQVLLQLTIAAPAGGGAAGYTGQIEVVGDVAFSEDCKASTLEKHQIAAWTATAALIGSARTYLDLFTALGPHPRATFGIINVASIIGEAVYFDEEAPPDQQSRRLYSLEPDTP